MFTPYEVKRKGAVVAALIVASVLCLIAAAFTAGRKTTPTEPVQAAPDARSQCWSRGGTTLQIDGESVCIDRRALL